LISTGRPMVKNKNRRKILNKIYSDWRLLNRQLKLRQIQNPDIDLFLSDGTKIQPKYKTRESKNDIVEKFLSRQNWISRDEYKSIIKNNRNYQIKILQYKNISTDDDRFHRMQWDRKGIPKNIHFQKCAEKLAKIFQEIFKYLRFPRNV